MSDVSARGRRDTSPDAEGRALGLNIGWTVFSYLLSGMAAYGAHRLADRARGARRDCFSRSACWSGSRSRIGFIIWRYGRNAGADGDKDMKTGMSAAAIRRASHRRGIPREEKSR